MQQIVTPPKPGLILTRKNGEGVRIGEDIMVTVLAVQPNYVRLHFNVPKDIIILREEVWQRQQSTDDPSKGS